MKDKLSLIIAVLALIGIGLSAVSLYNHYKKSATEYCDFGETFNCDVVNRSEYSRLLGVPVAGIGIVGYVVLLGLSRVRRQNRAASALLILLSLVALGFSVYLTYIEARVLFAYCIICLFSLATIAGITLLAIVRHVRASGVQAI
jgi:vitamin-K-epoxide reductase (warfarin-sensitive)